MATRLQERLLRLKNAAEYFQKHEAQQGWLPNAKYDDNTPVAAIANIQEYGAPAAGIPPRSFMRTTAEEKESEWSAMSERGLKAVTNGTVSPQNFLIASGQKIAGDIREKITQIDSPALSPITLMLRKMKSEGRNVTGRTVGEAAARAASGESTSGVPSEPLRDSGLMLSTLVSVIVENTDES